MRVYTVLFIDVANGVFSINYMDTFPAIKHLTIKRQDPVNRESKHLPQDVEKRHSNHP